MKRGAAIATLVLAPGCGSRTSPDKEVSVARAPVDAEADVTAPCTHGIVDLATGNYDGTYGVATDADNVYWVGGRSEILSVPKCGGAVRVIASVGEDPGSLVADDTGLYWVDMIGVVRRYVASTGEVTVLATTDVAVVYGAIPLSINDTEVFWLGPSLPCHRACVPNTTVYAASKTGSPANVIGSSQAPFGGPIGSTSTSVVWFDSGRLLMVPPSGGEAKVVATAARVWAIAADGESLYFSSRDSILRVFVTGGAVTTLASGQAAIGSVAARDGEVYWTSAADGGSIVKVAASGGEPVTLARQQAIPGAISVDETSVYFTTTIGSGGAVRKLTPR